MEKVQALFFDVGGTIFDWKNTVRDKIRELAGRHGQSVDDEAFAGDWRTEMFRIHTGVRQGDLPWMNSDDMHLAALHVLADRYPLISALDDPMALVADTWHRLRPFAGAAEAVDRLRSRYLVVVLTILSFESIVKSSKAAGVQWDGIVSCEFLGHYKPSLQAYVEAAELLGLNPEEAMMAAAHEGDLAAAQNAGLHTAYIKVPETDLTGEAFGQSEAAGFDIEAEDFDELCRKLSV